MRDIGCGVPAGWLQPQSADMWLRLQHLPGRRLCRAASGSASCTLVAHPEMFLSPARAENAAYNKYPGPPLQPGQIRLIRVLPGAWLEPVRCHLFNALHDTATYQALSYVWGSQRVTRTIVVNNKPYLSTVNLESALRHLRERHRDGIVLWVDALCINQYDTNERTGQVQLMGHIYKMCSKVIVYLGDKFDGLNKIDKCPPAVVDFDQLSHLERPPLLLQGNRDTRQDMDVFHVFRLLQELSTDVHLHEISGLRLDNLKIKEFALTRRGMGDDADEQRSERRRAQLQSWEEQRQQRTHLIECLRKLMHSPFTPWWNRIWVIQEVVAPPLVEIIYGGCSATWNMFTLAAWSLTKHSTHCCAIAYTRLPRDLRKVLEDFNQRVTGIDELRVAQNELSRHARAPKPGSRSLLELLRRFRDRKASDPRDKVYALLSLVEHDEECAMPPMLPNYVLRESEVFVQATLQCIYTSKSLSVFSTELGRKFRSDLPSWVPDWGAPGSYTYTARAHAVELYDACPSVKTMEELVSLWDKACLKVRGFEFEKVQARGATMWGDDANFCRDTLAKWWQYNPRGSFSKDSVTGNGDRRFWALICSDVISKTQATHAIRRAIARDELHFVTWSLVSSRSPFLEAPEYIHDALWSKSANAYRILLQLWPGLAASASKRTSQNPKEYVPQWRPREEEIQKHGPLITIDEQAMIKRFLNVIRPYEPFITTELVDDAGHFRADAPWKDFYKGVTKQLSENYGLDDSAKLFSTDEDVLRIDNSIMSATFSRRLLVGEHHVGLGPADTRVGDELCFLEGGKTPFVVRRRDADDSNRAGLIEYEVIGDCYVQDMMDDGPAQLTRSWRDLLLV